MAATLTEWWNDIAPKLRRAFGFAPLTAKEAGMEIAEAEAVPMTDEEIEEIVRFAVDTAAEEMEEERRLDKAEVARTGSL